METPAPIESVRLGIRQSVVKTAAAPSDDLVVARRRMRHLAPWDIKPLPMMHAVAGLSDEPLLPEQRERNKKRPLRARRPDVASSGQERAALNSPAPGGAARGVAV